MSKKGTKKKETNRDDRFTADMTPFVTFNDDEVNKKKDKEKNEDDSKRERPTDGNARK